MSDVERSHPLEKEVVREFGSPPEPKEERPKKPTEDELGDGLIAEWDGARKFFYGAWHKYEGGVWTIDHKIGLEFWRVLKANKKNGIKPKSGLKDSLDKYCRDYAVVDDADINAGMNYINLRNGVYNLTTDDLEPHRADLYMTSQLPFDYEPEATCDEWWRFLHQALRTPDGNEIDTDLWRLVQEAFGYSLTADTSHRVSFWCVGASGAGKSTLVNALIALAGDSHATIDLDTLKDDQYQIANVAGKRLVTFSEPDSRAPLADGWYKKLVSKDTISARQAYGKPFNFVPTCKLWGSMNFTPRVFDRSGAVFNRVIIIPMNRVMPVAQQDKHLDEKLIAELPGIFNWALGGLRRLRANKKFYHAQQSADAGADFQTENDIERAFIEDCYKRDPEGRELNKDIRDKYKAWCEENGYQPKGDRQLGKEFKRLGLSEFKSNGVRGWKGLTSLGQKINLSDF